MGFLFHAVFHKNCSKRKGNLACLTPHHGSCLVHTTLHLLRHSCRQWPFLEVPWSSKIRAHALVHVGWSPNTFRNTRANAQERMPDSIQKMSRHKKRAV
jgi:hypothetical protein